MKNYTTAKELAAKALALTVKNGGATLDPKTGQEVTSGFAVGGIQEFKFYDARIGQLDEIIAAVVKIRKANPTLKIGFWLDGSTLYVDAIAVMKSEESAKIVAEAFEEIAIYNLDKNEEIRLK